MGREQRSSAGRRRRNNGNFGIPREIKHQPQPDTDVQKNPADFGVFDPISSLFPDYYFGIFFPLLRSRIVILGFFVGFFNSWILILGVFVWFFLSLDYYFWGFCCFSVLGLLL